VQLNPGANADRNGVNHPCYFLSSSWVIREKSSGRVVRETFSAKVVVVLNTARYEAVPILEYLQSLNRGTPMTLDT